MSDAVDLLERLGAGARYSQEAAGLSDDGLSGSGVDRALLEAMRAGDAAQVRDLLGQKPYVGVVMPAEEEGEEEGEGESEQAPKPDGRRASTVIA